MTAVEARPVTGAVVLAPGDPAVVVTDGRWTVRPVDRPAPAAALGTAEAGEVVPSGRVTALCLEPVGPATLAADVDDPDAARAWLRRVDAAVRADAPPDVAGGLLDLDATAPADAVETLVARHLRIEATRAAARRARLAGRDRALTDDAAVFVDALAGSVEEIRRAEPGPVADADARCLELIGAPVPRADEPAGAGPTGRARLDALAARATAAGHIVRTARLEGRWWKAQARPVVALLDGAPVVLAPTPRGVRVLDPAGARPVRAAAVRTRIGTEVLTAVDTLPAETGWGDLIRLGLRGNRGAVLALFATTVAAGVLAMLVPLASGLIFGQIVPDDDAPRLFALVVALVLAAAGTALLGVLQARALTLFRTRSDAATGDAVWSRLVQLPVRFHADHSASDLLQRAGTIDSLRTVVGGSVGVGVVAAVTALVSFAVLFTEGTTVGLLALAIVGVNGVTVWCVQRRRARHARELIPLRTALERRTLEAVTAIARVRVFGAESRVLTQLGRGYAAMVTNRSRDARVEAVQASVDAAWPTLGILVVAAGVASAGISQGTIATYITMTTALGQLLGATAAVLGVVGQLVEVRPQAERLRPVLDAVPESQPSHATAPTLTGEIALDRVTFRYTPDAPPVLEDVDLRIAAGEFVAVVGPSGCGKSTLLRLLLGFEQPEAGRVSYDGHDLAHLDVRGVRQQLGTVLQSAELFPGTLAENISAARTLSREQLWQAAASAAVADDIRAMPMQLETLVVEGAAAISGGQRQRVVIARALAGSPAVLLFDEATSALDNATQAEVAEALERLSVTRIVVAHRLSTIRHADRIVVLDAGRIVQSGTYDDLVDQPGLFADLARRQLLG